MTLHDNYDALGYDAAAVARCAVHAYISEREVLRSHTSALIPARYGHWMQMSTTSCSSVRASSTAAMRSTACTPAHLTSSTSGVSPDRQLDSGDLKEMVEIVVRAALPGAEYRVDPRVHPYTTEGCRSTCRTATRGSRSKCGLAAAHVLDGAGVRGTGLAMGLGLDRILMLRKGIADIRLLGADDPRIAGQMRDLGLYRPVSNRPAVTRPVDCSSDIRRGRRAR